MPQPAIRRGAAPARETKLLADPGLLVSPAGEFEGYASLFGVADLGGDTVERGAFSASLARRGPDGVRMLWQHDPNEPLGRWLSVVEDRLGLRVRGRLNPAVARAREVAALMREGGVDGLSIGFRTVEAERDRRSGGRRLLQLDLWEISIVTFPMLPGARVAVTPMLGALARAGTALPATASLPAAIRRAARRLSPPAASPAYSQRTR